MVCHRCTHITSSLRTLHWLPIRQRIIFKTLALVYKYLITGQPKYFAPSLSLYKSTMNTRSSNPQNLFLQVPHYCASIHKSKVHFNNSFSYDALKSWEWSSRWYPQCSKSLLFQKSTKNLPISEIISTLASNYRTPDRLPGYDLEHV